MKKINLHHTHLPLKILFFIAKLCHIKFSLLIIHKSLGLLMYIKCWGARGSISVSGSNYLKYGGDTTCLELRTRNNEIIIVDAGTGIRRLGNYLIKNKDSRYNMLFTHAHWDHIMGFPFFKPIFFPETKLNIIRCPAPEKYIENIIKKVMSPPYFPVKYKDIQGSISYTKGCPGSFMIDSVKITPIKLNHPDSGCGYKFEEDGKIFVFLTDNELGYVHNGGLSIEDYAIFSKNADLLIHDSEYNDEDYKKKKTWGHSTVNQAAELAKMAGVKALGLFHHDQDKHDDDIDRLVETAEIYLKDYGIKVFGVSADMEFYL
ncbi:MAG: MBL fold metallo-hydrolase [Deltaproteobacteria bacterium]|nr:MAG: MBL fold metallo-hydrolase [Deltaproteobacteria bacterium]